MTKIKFCGLSSLCDIEAANRLKPEYIGFVFAKKSKRYISPQTAKSLKERLLPEIAAVGVFVDETVETIANLLNGGIIDMAQLHGKEDENFIARLRKLTDKPLIKAFRINTAEDIKAAMCSTADFVLLDSGAGTGTVFDWSLAKDMKRPYFLAGGLCAENARQAVEYLRPYAADVSSGIETDGVKDEIKMAAFAAEVRGEEKI